MISLVWLGQVPGPVELAGGAIALAGVALAGSRPRARVTGAWAREAGEVAGEREGVAVR